MKGKNMSRPKPLIERLLRDEFAQGASLSEAALAMLRDARRTTARMGVIVFIAVLAGVAAAGYLALKYVDDPSAMAAITGAFGLSVGGALEMLRRTWRDWGYFNLLIILVGEADEAGVSEILRTVAQKL